MANSVSIDFAQCIGCDEMCHLDEVLSKLDDSSRKTFIANYTESFLCKSCFGTSPSDSACRHHLIALEIAFKKKTEASFKEVERLAVRLKLFMKAYSFFTELPNPDENHFRNCEYVVDENSINYLVAFGDVRQATHTPLSVKADGDCLFNTVSMGLWNSEAHSKQLRLLMSLEIITCRKKYDRLIEDTTADLFCQSFGMFDTYFDLVADAVRVSAYMTPSHIVALANALCVPIQLSLPVTPNDKDSFDLPASEMNKRIVLDCEGEIKLDSFTWGWSVLTTTAATVPFGKCHADVYDMEQNHFCLLVKNTLLAPIIERTCSTDDAVSGCQDADYSSLVAAGTEATSMEVEANNEHEDGCIEMAADSSDKYDSSDCSSDCILVETVLEDSVSTSAELNEDNDSNLEGEVERVIEYNSSLLHQPTDTEHRTLSTQKNMTFVYMHNLPSNKPLGACQMLHELRNMDFCKVARNVEKFQENMLGKFYFSFNEYGTKVDDDFNNYLPEGYTTRHTYKRVYVIRHGKYVAVKKIQKGYVNTDGSLLSSEDYASILHLSYYRVNYNDLARVVACLTDSMSNAITPVLIMYPCVKGKKSLPPVENANFQIQSYILNDESDETVYDKTLTVTESLKDTFLHPTHNEITGKNPVRSNYVTKSVTKRTGPDSPALKLNERQSPTTVSPGEKKPTVCKTNLKFLSPLEAYDVVIAGALQTIPCIPLGLKENCRFVVSGEYSKSVTTGKQIYVDDSFRKSVGRTESFYYLMPYRARLYKNGDKFFARRKTGGVLAGEIIEIVRRRSELECGLSRCVTTIKTRPDEINPVLWEYSGEGANDIHPNKLRTNPNAIASLLPVLKYVDPKVLYRQVTVEGKIILKDTQQLANAKARDKKRQTEKDGGCSSTVYGEQVQCMLSSQVRKLLPISAVTTLPDVPAVFHLSEKYLFQDICRFCMSHEAMVNPPAVTKRDKRVRKLGVLGIDKTYNLTECHVTTTVYRNFGLVHNKTSKKGNNPYFLGPLLLHATSTEDIFRRFLTEIDIELQANGYKPNVGPQVVVCDGEMAIRNAINSVWPQASVYYCHQHLKGNLSRQLKLGKNGETLRNEARENLEAKVFYQGNCLASKKTVASFNNLKNEVLESAGNADPDDKSGTQVYLDDTLFPKMIANIEIMEKFPDMDLFMLTNNATEAMNNELKRRCDFKTVSITEFAKLIKVHEYDFRINETFRAVLETGDYRLSSYFSGEFTEEKNRTWYSYGNQKVYDEAKKEAYMSKFQKTHLPLNHCLIADGGVARSTTASGRLVTLVPKPRAAQKPCNRQSSTQKSNNAKQQKIVTLVRNTRASNNTCKKRQSSMPKTNNAKRAKVVKKK